MLRQLYSVNQLAEELGITPRTIRFYESQGLIAPNRAGTTRVLDRRDRARLMLILRGKRLGFSLQEIGEYLDLYDTDRSQVGQMRRLLEKVRERVALLERQRQDLDQALRELRDIERQATEALSEREAPGGVAAGAADGMAGAAPVAQPATAAPSEARPEAPEDARERHRATAAGMSPGATPGKAQGAAQREAQGEAQGKAQGAARARAAERQRQAGAAPPSRRKTSQ
ncbi:MerR family transcriptional regulator [Roseomonas acroporae]|uniref:MerR family transcriptional regulator n=1 Tax=Roseomonas acroporae TaxID=2937791 RepID=UPI0031F48F32